MHMFFGREFVFPEVFTISERTPHINQVIINIDAKNSTMMFFEQESKMVLSKREFERRLARRARMAGGVFTSFIDAAMKEAKVERLSDGAYYAEIPSCPGVWAEGATEEECIATLQEVLEEWLLFKLRDGDTDIPVLGGVDLNSEWKEDPSWA